MQEDAANRVREMNRRSKSTLSKSNGAMMSHSEKEQPQKPNEKAKPNEAAANHKSPLSFLKSLDLRQLISGGEQSMVAIAIYFAILKASPAPFCILDEIDAALDDVNVTRYSSYLKRLEDRTQFIAITHRRGTMEAADVLYGVTMQEVGVSKVLKLDVSEVESKLGITADAK